LNNYVEEFDVSLGDNQFITVYSRECESCGATGSVYATVNPLYVSIEENDEENEEKK